MRSKFLKLFLAPCVMIFATLVSGFAATQPQYVLSVVNYNTAEDCLNTIPPGPTTRYMQDGQDVPAGGADLSGALCVGERVNFRLTPGQTYRVLRIVKTTDEEGVDVYQTRLILDTHSNDPEAKFIIGCLASDRPPTMNEVKRAMRGIFKITP